MDDDLLRTAVERRSALALLAERPCHYSDLRDALDVSKSTCHRIARSLEDGGLVQRTERGCELTPLGQAVYRQVAAFERGIDLAQRLRPVLSEFAAANIDFDLEPFRDGTVTCACEEDPSAPIHRYLELVESADRLRGMMHTAFLPPLYEERIFGDGGGPDDGIIITSSSILARLCREFPEVHRTVYRSGDGPQYRVCEDLSVGVDIFDESRVVIRGYHEDADALVACADTEHPDAVTWANELFERYYDRSEPADAVDAAGVARSPHDDNVTPR